MAEGGKPHGVKEERQRESEEYQIDEQDEEGHASAERARTGKEKAPAGDGASEGQTEGGDGAPGRVSFMTEKLQQGCSTSREELQHRHRQCTSSSSSSEGRTPSRERCARSKWSLKRHVENRKDTKKLSLFELIEASFAWALDFKDTDYAKLRRFIKHIGYVIGKAKSGVFLDKEHNAFDQAVRKLAISEGFEAFSRRNGELSLKYYAYENMKRQGGMGHGMSSRNSHGGSKTMYTKDSKKPCFAFKHDQCTYGYGHWCSRCGARSHIRSNCPKD